MSRDRPSIAALLTALPIALLGVAFVVLKSCGVVSGSWWLVLAPFWFPVALIAACLLLVTAAGVCDDED